MEGGGGRGCTGYCTGCCRGYVCVCVCVSPVALSHSSHVCPPGGSNACVRAKWLLSVVATLPDSFFYFRFVCLLPLCVALLASRSSSTFGARFNFEWRPGWSSRANWAASCRMASAGARQCISRMVLLFVPQSASIKKMPTRIFTPCVASWGVSMRPRPRAPTGLRAGRGLGEKRTGGDCPRDDAWMKRSARSRGYC